MRKEKTKEEHYNRFFINLGNPTKISIIKELEKGEKTVNQMAELLGEERSVISHALSELLGCSFVFVRKKGRERIYQLNRDTILSLLNLADRHVEKYCSICRRI